jgi:rhodanese-related sulfurtransferase
MTQTMQTEIPYNDSNLTFGDMIHKKEHCDGYYISLDIMKGIINDKPYPYTVIDTRTNEEREMMGSISESEVVIDMISRTDEEVITYLDDLEKGDTDVYMVYCLSGIRSCRLVEIMRERNMNAYSLEDGCMFLLE